MPRSPHAGVFLAPLLLLIALVVPFSALPSPAHAEVSTGPAAGAYRTTSGSASATLGSSARRASWLSGWASAPRSVPAGAVYSAALRVSGGARPVLMQRKVRSGWRTVARTRSDAAGRVGLRWSTPRHRSRIPLRVLAPGSAAGVGVATRVRVVHVRPRAVRDGLTVPLRRVLVLVNQVRTTGQRCGGEWYPAVRAVRIDSRLNRAAAGFARTMAREDFFSHESPDGRGPGERIDAAGYRWSTFGENIAGGHETPDAVVRGWLESPGHCANLMGRYTDMGLGFAYDPGSTYHRYWVQEFATR